MIHHHRRSPISPGLIFGGIAVAGGIFLLLRNFGYVPNFRLLDLFPLFLVVFGIANLAGQTALSGRIWGAILTAIGGYWLADNLGLVRYHVHDIWPAILVLLGIHLLIQAAGHRRAAAASTTSDSVINETAVCGGGKRAVTSHDFQGGELYAFCGGHEIDLRQSVIAGESAVIDATAIFGGVALLVPETWDVAMEGVAVFGGYEDKTHHPHEGEPSKRLIVRGLAVFGGVEVKN